MTTQEKSVVRGADPTVERRIAGEALARLRELFGTPQTEGRPSAAISFSYVANRLFWLASLPGDSR